MGSGNEIHTIDIPRIEIKHSIIDDETKAILAKNLSLLTKKKYKNINGKQKITPNETIIDTIEQGNIKPKDTIGEKKLIQNRTLSKEKQGNTESTKVIKKDKIIRSREIKKQTINSSIQRQQKTALQLYTTLSCGYIDYLQELYNDFKTPYNIGNITGAMSHAIAMNTFNILSKGEFLLGNYGNMKEYITPLDASYKTDFILIENKSTTKKLSIYLMDVKSNSGSGISLSKKTNNIREEIKTLFDISNFENMILNKLGIEKNQDNEFSYHKCMIKTGFKSDYFEIGMFKEYLNLYNTMILHQFNKIIK